MTGRSRAFQYLVVVVALAVFSGGCKKRVRNSSTKPKVTTEESTIEDDPNNLFGGLTKKEFTKLMHGWILWSSDESSPEELEQAVKIFQTAADLGHPKAYQFLGYCYRDGRGIAKNPIEAVKCFRSAATLGNSAAKVQLAEAYREGNGVTKDVKFAYALFKEAAEQKDVDAYVGLGFCYDFGEGVPKDDAEAYKWFRKAADLGSSRAQAMIGLYLERGYAVEQNNVEAYMWYNLSASSGDETAAKRRDELETKMTQGQVAEAQKLSREWKPVK